MLKYAGYDIVFQEIPDEVTLALNLSGALHLALDLWLEGEAAAQEKGAAE